MIVETLKTRVGPAGHPTRHPKLIPIKQALYNPTAQTITLTPSVRLNLHHFYRLTVNASPQGGIASTGGAFLDGANTGQPGATSRSNIPTLLTNQDLSTPLA